MDGGRGFRGSNENVIKDARQQLQSPKPNALFGLFALLLFCSFVTKTLLFCFHIIAYKHRYRTLNKSVSRSVRRLVRRQLFAHPDYAYTALLSEFNHRFPLIFPDIFCSFLFVLVSAPLHFSFCYMFVPCCLLQNWMSCNLN